MAGRQVVGPRRRSGQGDVQGVARGLSGELLRGRRRRQKHLVGNVRAIEVAVASTAGRTNTSRPRSFDLVVGADGLHSTVRRLVFGPEDRFVRPFGMHVVGFPPQETPTIDALVVVVHNPSGRSATIHPGAGQPVAALIFRSPRMGRPAKPRACVRPGSHDSHRHHRARRAAASGRIAREDPSPALTSRHSVAGGDVERMTRIELA